MRYLLDKLASEIEDLDKSISSKIKKLADLHFYKEFLEIDLNELKSMINKNLVKHDNDIEDIEVEK